MNTIVLGARIVTKENVALLPLLVTLKLKLEANRIDDIAEAELHNTNLECCQYMDPTS